MDPNNQGPQEHHDDEHRPGTGAFPGDEDGGERRDVDGVDGADGADRPEGHAAPGDGAADRADDRAGDGARGAVSDGSGAGVGPDGPATSGGLPEPAAGTPAAPFDAFGVLDGAGTGPGAIEEHGPSAGTTPSAPAPAAAPGTEPDAYGVDGDAYGVRDHAHGADAPAPPEAALYGAPDPYPLDTPYESDAGHPSDAPYTGATPPSTDLAPYAADAPSTDLAPYTGGASYPDASSPQAPADPVDGGFFGNGPAAPLGKDASVRRARPVRDPLGPDFGPASGGLARTARVISDDLLITVNPVDGSEAEVCPPGELPARPGKRGPAVRAERRRAARPPVPTGPAHGAAPLLERAEDRERLVRLLGRGRSVRLTGPGGSGRSSLLDEVAAGSGELAPDGVVRLNGRGRTPTDLLHELFAEVYEAPLHRPGHPLLLDLLREIGAVVVIDDLEFGGAALDELLDATPECAFLFATTPDIPAPSSEAHLEEVFLSGVGRGSGLELLERAVGRPLSDEEANWAGDLWFESEGLPLRFVQAGALLLQRDRLRADPTAFEEFGYFTQPPVDAAFDADDGEVLLPSLAEGAAPAAALASRLSPSAREALRYAVALNGELPHPAHLPALTGDTHADAALTELTDTVLVTPAGGGYRLAAGVLLQLDNAGYGEDADTRADAAARHYAWWAAHPSVTPERVAAEAEAVLAALAAVVAAPLPPAAEGEGPEESEEDNAGVLLARAAAPALATALHWGAWERALRSGQEAARLAGKVSDEAYFHHELGVLALCEGRLDRARAELEASIALRGALADRRGTVAGRRALALVADRSGITAAEGRTAAGEEVPAAPYEESASPPGGVPSALVAQPPTHRASQSPLLSTTAAQTVAGNAARAGGRRTVLTGARRNLVAAGAGALLVAVLGTVVTLGATSDKDDAPADRVKSEQSASTDDGENGVSTDRPDDGDSGSTKQPGDGPSATDPGEDGVLGTADDPTPSADDSGSATPGAGDATGKGEGSGKPDDPEKPSTSHKPSKPGKPSDSGKPSDPGTPPPSGDPSDPPPSGDPSDPPTSPEDPGTSPSEPETTDSASGTMPGTPADSPRADGQTLTDSAAATGGQAGATGADTVI